MAVIGLFLGQQITDEKLRDDIDFFAFPEIDPSYGQDTVEAPTDGFMLSRKPKNEDGANKLLEFLGSAKAENLYMGVDPSNVAVNSEADTSTYNALQKKSAELIASAKHITQFGDRDSDPGFISTVVLPGPDPVAGPPRRRLGPAEEDRVPALALLHGLIRTGKVHHVLRVAPRPPSRPRARTRARAGSRRGDRALPHGHRRHPAARPAGLRLAAGAGLRRRCPSPAGTASS